MTGRPAPEVIQEWADGDSGWTFERGRMERNVRDICFDRPAVYAPPATTTTAAAAAAGSNSTNAIKLKKDDVDFIVNELWISRAAAEKALRASVGDVTLAIKSIVLPREDL
ncbi:hypothetical protein IE81DRAFT_326951 [Ceraceosorus guamensis]|uniref:Nascent polypeptide-associated complex subunit alpha-like UBA domain-containing protein n=1 Tax=Ceraceosorus guamensis TaxID=1522189 RepID=A0A316VU38_9BASI|nr:hypothetical protein IE81DRAFT_326951 [Ceraceosorus guamensis]PWN39025.1 hypothetical protein IE81DRAFT_326951 [Ceraceosorus guamensis]